MNNIFRTKALTHEQKIENKRNVQKTMFNKNATQKKTEYGKSESQQKQQQQHTIMVFR